jgi:hypothetical protein
MPFDPNLAKKAGKKSKRGPAKKEGHRKVSQNNYCSKNLAFILLAP